MLQRSPQRLLCTQCFTWYLHHFGLQMSLKDHIDAIRWGTFEALGIQHTCCREAYGYVPVYDTDDIREIEEEQAALLVTLEDLVEDFQGRVNSILEQEDADVIGDIKQFWTGYWRDRNEPLSNRPWRLASWWSARQWAAGGCDRDQPCIQSLYDGEIGDPTYYK